VKVPFVDLKAQYAAIKEEIDEAIKNVIDNTRFIGGEELVSFEENYAKFCRAKYCIGVSNGTAALQAALKCYGISTGDEVITVTNSFIATTEAITNVGADIRFVPVDKKTYNMDPEKIKEAITKKTRAVMPVHLYGQPADMKRIHEIAEEHDLKVVEDAAQAHGAECYGRRLPYSDTACFSFFPGKNLGAYGDAGAVVTNDDELASEIMMLRNHGREEGEKYRHKKEGENVRMDTIQAAVLGVKLKYLDEWTEKRRKNAESYNSALEGMEEFLSTPAEADYARHVYHLYVIRCKKRDALMEHLKKNNISCGIHYPIPLHMQPAYKRLGMQEGSFVFEEVVAKEILSLPMYPELSNEQIKFVVEKIKEFYEN